MSIVRCSCICSAGTLSASSRSRASASSCRTRARAPPVDGVDRAEEHRGEVVANVDEQAAERRGDARVRRHEHGRDRQLLARAPRRAAGRRRRRRRGRTREGRNPRRIEISRTASAMFAFATWMTAFAASTSSSPSGSPTPVTDGPLGGGPVEPHRPADQLVAEPAEHEVRVGVRRLVVAPPVARRARVGARRLRPVAERAGLVDPRERPAPGADRQHLDRGKADRVAVLDEPLLGHPRLAVVDERDVGARAAHVEADRVREAAERREVPARDRAGGDARGGEPHGEASATACGVITPPPECRSRRSPSYPPSASRLPSRSTYPPTRGESTAFATVVEKRSCSKISGRTSADVDTATPGSSSSRISRIRSSCAGFA